MNIRKITLGLTAALLLPSAAFAQEVVLKVAHFLPAIAPMHARVIAPWCDKIAAESQGKLKC
ncbi:MAG: C4-dicarboxylate ABC transporter, partial [Betaproteobacteria bacterium HGW-Betaproteobacteria-19]